MLRGGWAIYAVPALFDISGIYQPGFSQATNIVPTLDTGVTIRATLANPFPDGVPRRRANSNGVNTFLGRGIGRFNDDLDYRNGQSMRWSVSMQRELPGQWVVEGAYVASRSYDLTTDFNMNFVPRQYLSTQQRPRQHGDQLVPDRERHQSVRRPAARRDAEQRAPTSASSCCGRIRSSATSTCAATTARAAFDSAQFRLERRFSGGYTVLDQLHLVELQGAGDAAERHRHRLRRALPGHAPAAPPGDERHLGAAVRPGPALRAATPTRSSTRSSATGASRRSGTGSRAVRT